jgi:hypothetical protein
LVSLQINFFDFKSYFFQICHYFKSKLQVMQA